MDSHQFIEKNEYRQHDNAFKTYLRQHGWVVLVPRADNEVLRFRAAENTGVGVDATKQNKVILNPLASRLWRHFKEKTPCEAGYKLQRRSNYKDDLNTLYLRDNAQCFFCLEHVHRDDASVEHLLPISLGGSDHIANLVLTHRTCNCQAGNKSLAEKSAIREAHLKAAWRKEWEVEQAAKAKAKKTAKKAVKRVVKAVPAKNQTALLAKPQTAAKRVKAVKAVKKTTSHASPPETHS